MSSASQLIWRSAGCPSGQRGELAEDVDGVCALCGHGDTATVALTVACPPASFGGWQQMRWPSSDRVCRACTWAMEGKPPNTLRMWSILYRGDGVSGGIGPDMGDMCGAFNRSDLSAVLECLCWPPDCEWSAGLAESGKVHIVPYMTVNRGAGAWSIRVDRVTFRSDPATTRRVVHHVSSLIDAGFRVKAILDRNPPIRDLVKFGLDTWKRHIEALGPLSAGQVERIAAMIIKKEKANEWRERTSGDA